MLLAVVVTFTFFVHIGFTGSKVSISLYAIQQGAGAGTIGVMMAMFAVFPMLLAVVAGKVVDRVGVRRPMLLSCFGISAGIALPSIYESVWTLFVSTTLLGMSAMFFLITAQSLTGAMGKPEDRTRNFAWLSLGFAAASVVGPLIAGFGIDYLGHDKAFIVLATAPLVPFLTLLVRPKLVPNIRVKAEDRVQGSVFDLLKIPPLRDTFIASGILSSAWDLYQFFLPIYAHSVGISASAIGAILAAFAVAIFIIRAILPQLMRRASEQRLLRWAMFVACVAYGLFPFFTAAWVLALVSFLLGCGVGVAQPLSMTLIYNLTPKGRVGEAAGVRVTFNNMTHVAVPLAFGALSTAFGHFAVFLGNAALLAIGGAVSRDRTGGKVPGDGEPVPDIAAAAATRDMPPETAPRQSPKQP
jgi:MFS family permease